MTDEDLGFVHRWVPGATPDAPTLLVLHGTGGNEDDLLQLAATLAPGAAMLSPRGKVLEHGMPRFFRRLAEGVFDLEDLQFRTYELADVRYQEFWDESFERLDSLLADLQHDQAD